MTARDAHQVEQIRQAASRWRTELRARSEAHRSSDALTELAWADRALAEVEQLALLPVLPTPTTDGAPYCGRGICSQLQDHDGPCVA